MKRHSVTATTTIIMAVLGGILLAATMQAAAWGDEGEKEDQLGLESAQPRGAPADPKADGVAGGESAADKSLDQKRQLIQLNPMSDYSDYLVSRVAEDSGTQTDDDANSATPRSPSRCSYHWRRVSYNNRIGQRLMSFRVTQRWCYDGRRITSVQGAEITVWLSTLATITGWDYYGIIGRSSGYYTYRGYSRGGYHVYRQGKFKLCPPRVFCIQEKRPSVHIWVHGDGTAHSQSTG